MNLLNIYYALSTFLCPNPAQARDTVEINVHFYLPIILVPKDQQEEHLTRWPSRDKNLKKWNTHSFVYVKLNRQIWKN